MNCENDDMTGVNQGKPCLATATLNRLSVDHPVKFCAGSNDHKCFEAFPYDAYDIQIDFMRKLYETLECGGIGLFESPTGMKMCLFRLFADGDIRLNSCKIQTCDNDDLLQGRGKR